MSQASIATPLGFGLLAFLVLLGVYFAALTLVSGWSLTMTQFADFWPFVVALAAGFGVQIGLYSRLRSLVRHGDAPGAVVAVSGGTSTAAMVSCCTHYLANVAPILGASGALALVAQYQPEFFWLGLAFNAAGIAYVGRKLAQASRHMAQMGAGRMTARATVLGVAVAMAIAASLPGSGAARAPGADEVGARSCHGMGPMTAWSVAPGVRSTVSDDGASRRESRPPAQAKVGNAERGREVYLARCTACHNADPTRNGPVGPALNGASIDLVRARVLWATYPSGYVPKRPTRIMRAQPDLVPWIADLAAFLRAR
jgi:mono/diheme cytochrome c family protein